MSTGNSGFVAPSNDSNRLNTPLLSQGYHLGILYGLIDLGTQDGGNFGPKHQALLAFEFPLQTAVFYEGEQPKPYANFNRETFSMASKSNLRKNFIEPMLGRKLDDKEAETFDISSLLGKQFSIYIQHTPDGKYANIASIQPLNQQNIMMFGLQPGQTVQQVNQTIFFHLSQGFNSPNFSVIPKYFRELIIGSAEGQAHKAAGGTFAEPQQTNGQQGAQAAIPTQNVGATRKVVMKPDSQYTYQQLKNASWTDDQIVQAGHGVWETIQQPAPPPTPPAVAQTPVPPSLPPVPETSAPAVPVKTLVMKNPTFTPQMFYDKGWTDEMIVKEGHGTFQ